MASTAARLAGMDIPTSTTPAPALVPTNADPESQNTHSITPRPSRASIPLDRRPSRKSIVSQKSRSSLMGAPASEAPPLPPKAAERAAAQHGPQYSVTSSSLPNGGPDTTAQEADEEGSDTEGEDLPWGPTHPCFPHPNPHVPKGSEAHETTRVIRVQRDWLVAGDAYPQFQNVYPEILAEWISEEEFRRVIEEVNGRCKVAFDPEGTRAKVDAVMGLLTGFVWDDAGFTGVKQGVKGLEGWMEGWNREREGRGLEGRLVPLRTTGWLNLDVVIPDPGIDIVDQER
ncbi:hypothetical protein C1H76_2129 [Elsinoe australis]|uniref:Ras modification protein ERF4 n=1 Tax=Elsinoe australis TaxID=40998 RepID=A0A4U7B3P4_9PEZI|nr:hypothetical protein C1H76_2129 [Elsinoe australis]